MQKIIPAILTADPEELKKQLFLLKDNTSWVHIDIMDQKFVESASINLADLDDTSQFFDFEIHLMTESPENYFEDCAKVGARRVFFHYEAAPDIEMVLRKASSYKFYLGVALGVQTSPEVIKKYLNLPRGGIQTVLVMGVYPGLQGQGLIPSLLEKVKKLKSMNDELLVGVDGGVHSSTLKQVFEAGADYVAVGSEIQKAENPIEALKLLEEMVK